MSVSGVRGAVWGSFVVLWAFALVSVGVLHAEPCVVPGWVVRAVAAGGLVVIAIGFPRGIRWDSVRRWVPELVLGSSVAAVVSIATLGTPLHAWEVLLVAAIGFCAFMTALADAIARRRGWARVLLAAGVWAIAPFVIFGLYAPLSSFGVDVRLSIVESRYRAAADDLLWGRTQSTGDPYAYAKVESAPSAGLVVESYDGPMRGVAWKWYLPLFFVGSEYGVVYFPGFTGDPDDVRLSHESGSMSITGCTSLRTDWLWCRFYP